jgi:hypothetical protein
MQASYVAWAAAKQSNFFLPVREAQVLKTLSFKAWQCASLSDFLELALQASITFELAIMLMFSATQARGTRRQIAESIDCDDGKTIFGEAGNG